MTRPRRSGAGRRFELVLLRLRPPSPETLGVIAKHASAHSYHWVLVLGSAHADPDRVARLLAVAYLDEASGLLGRGDPRWAVPRAYLRPTGRLDPRLRDESSPEDVPDAMRRELARITVWLKEKHPQYLADLCSALRRRPDARFRRLSAAEAEERGFSDPTGRALLAPHPPPIVTYAGSRRGGEGGAIWPRDPLPWRVRGRRQTG